MHGISVARVIHIGTFIVLTKKKKTQTNIKYIVHKQDEVTMLKYNTVRQEWGSL